MKMMITGKVSLEKYEDEHWRTDVISECLQPCERDSTLEEILMEFMGKRVKVTVEDAP